MYNPLKAVDQIVIAFALITLLFFVIVLGFSLSVRENSHRIREIQASRLESCQRTYSGIKEVFAPLIPVDPETRLERERIKKFYEEIEKLRKGCIDQTSSN
jgi:cell shape-determining protein MreC